MEKELKICEEHLLVKPPFQFCLETKQTVKEDDLVAQTEEAQSQMRKRWDSDLLQSNVSAGLLLRCLPVVSNFGVLKFSKVCFL